MASPNYSFATGTTADFDITARTLVVTPDDNQSKVYGSADPTLTYSHGTLYNGDSNTVFSGALSRTAGQDVGTYPIHLGTLSAGPNYTISLPGTSGQLQLPDRLHGIAITQATLNVNAVADSKVYGATDPTLTDTCRLPVLRHRRHLRDHRFGQLLADPG